MAARRRQEPDAHSRETDAYGTASFLSTKGDPDMMDCLMAGTLLIGFGLVWMLVHWCQRQVDSLE